MGMYVTLKQGESIVAFRRGDEVHQIKITMEKKLGNTSARFCINADESIVVLPPSKQKF